MKLMFALSKRGKKYLFLGYNTPLSAYLSAINLYVLFSNIGEINVIMYTMDGRRQFISNIPRTIVDQCKRLELQRDRTDAWTKSDAIAVSDSDVKKYCTKDDNSSR
jgi:hypothetical protein